MTPPDLVLRARIVEALRALELPAGIKSRLRFGELADAVLGIGQFDVVLNDGVHLYNSTHCRHGNEAACDSPEHGSEPGQCGGCGSACRHTYEPIEPIEGIST